MRHSQRFIFLFFLIFGSSAFLLSGCASLGTYNPATDRREFIFIDADQEIEMGKSFHQELLKQYQLSRDLKDLAWVERVGRTVAQVSDRQDYAYHFFVIEKDELNAFTLPGGNIYIYTGLLHKLKNDDQLAAVLAHEIGHCAAKHVVKKYQAAMSYDLIGNIIFSQVGSEGAGQLAQMSASSIMQLIFSSYSRHDEFEADHIGIKYMIKAHYRPQGMIETFEILEAESKGPDVPLILRSHPFIKDRIAAVKNEIVRRRWEEEKVLPEQKESKVYGEDRNRGQ